MVAFDQFLIAGLDGSASRLCVKSKRFQCLGLKRLGLALARLRLGSATEHAERIMHAAVVAGMAGALLREVRSEARVAVGAHRPGRPMAGQRLLLKARDV